MSLYDQLYETAGRSGKGGAMPHWASIVGSAVLSTSRNRCRRLSVLMSAEITLDRHGAVPPV